MENSFSAKASQDTNVNVTDWVACYNPNDNAIVLSCTVTASNSEEGISGVGLILNSGEGLTLATCYNGMSSPSPTVYPSINLKPGNLNVGSDILAVAQGECNGKHFFFEERLTVSQCQTA